MSCLLDEAAVVARRLRCSEILCSLEDWREAGDCRGEYMAVPWVRGDGDYWSTVLRPSRSVADGTFVIKGASHG